MGERGERRERREGEGDIEGVRDKGRTVDYSQRNIVVHRHVSILSKLEQHKDIFTLCILAYVSGPFSLHLMKP